LAVEAEGRVAKQDGGRGWYASVRLSLVPAIGREVALAPSSANEWYRSEGWLDAAVTGAGLGLELAQETGRCSITSLHGMVCDTSSAIVVLAAVRAVWAALAFVPNELMAKAIEGCISRGHQLSVDAVQMELLRIARHADPGTLVDPKY
jgi:hypothetical protein